MTTNAKYKYVLVLASDVWGDCGGFPYVESLRAWNRRADELCAEWGIRRRDASPEPIRFLGAHASKRDAMRYARGEFPRDFD